MTHYAYQSLSVDQERQYLNIETVVNDSELTDRAVRQALIGLRQWVKRNNYLRKQLGIMDSIEVVLKKEGLLCHHYKQDGKHAFITLYTHHLADPLL